MNTRRIIFIPHVKAAARDHWPGAAVAVLDILRATTSITAALQAGCQCIRPYQHLATARRQAHKLRQAGLPVWLAGERRGLRPPGFAAGNSPTEFLASRGKTVVMSTSNGTRALVAAKNAAWVILVCLNNLSAAVQVLSQLPVKRLIILAAGEKGHAAAEDHIAAGLLLQQLLKANPGPNRWELDSGACQVYAQVKKMGKFSMKKYLWNTPHGRELICQGFSTDIAYAARIDSTAWVGAWSPFGIIPIVKLHKRQPRLIKMMRWGARGRGVSLLRNAEQLSNRK